jgi:hypothetical protein
MRRCESAKFGLSTSTTAESPASVAALGCRTISPTTDLFSTKPKRLDLCMMPALLVIGGRRVPGIAALVRGSS